MIQKLIAKIKLLSTPVIRIQQGEKATLFFTYRTRFDYGELQALVKYLEEILPEHHVVLMRDDVKLSNVVIEPR
jgi:hypothetical protein